MRNTVSESLDTRMTFKIADTSASKLLIKLMTSTNDSHSIA
jgi:hypothetical protein